MLLAAQTVNGSLIRSFAWLLASLSMVALLSQPGAIQDEWSYAASVWCGQGERTYYCPEVQMSPAGTKLVRTNIADQDCWAKQTAPILCPEAPTQQNSIEIRDATNSSLFNFVNSWLVVPSVDLSVVLIRLANALLLTSTLAILSILLPTQYRMALALLIVAVLAAPGLFMMVSINPLSWTTIGVGLGWLPLQAAMASTGLTSAHRRLLVAIGVLLFALAVGSHRSAIGFSVAVLLISTTHLLWLKIPHRRGLLFGATTSLGGILLLMLEWLPPRVLHALWMTPSRVESATPSGGEFENYYYLRDLLPVVPNVARSLFGFPGWNPSNPLLLTVAVPEVVTFGCIGLFGYLLIQTYNSRQKLQMFGAGAVLVIASLVLFAQVASQTDKQYATSDVLVIYPLLIFLSVWWFFHAPEGLSEKLKSSLRSASKIATVLFSLSIFTVAERFVDRQSFGLRYLPEGRDQWWWTWFPVGPNVVVVLAPFFLWRFLSAYLAMLSSDQRALADR